MYSGRDHLCVIEYKAVAFSEKRGEIFKNMVGNTAAYAVQKKKTAAVAFLQRSLCNQVFRKIVIEIFGAHQYLNSILIIHQFLPWMTCPVEM